MFFKKKQDKSIDKYLKSDWCSPLEAFFRGFTPQVHEQWELFTLVGLVM